MARAAQGESRRSGVEAASNGVEWAFQFSPRRFELVTLSTPTERPTQHRYSYSPYVPFPKPLLLTSPRSFDTLTDHLVHCGCDHAASGATSSHENIAPF